MSAKLLRPWVILIASWAVLAGCESLQSMRDSVRDRFASVPPKVRVVHGDPGQVYKAARVALLRLGYRIERGGPAEGSLEGLTPVGAGEDFESSVQRDITIHLRARDDGTVEVQVLLRQMVEDRFSRASNPATETPLRDSAAYDAFFDELDRQLQGPGGK